ncbi:MAG: hypothetical protein M1360_04600 [Candidatus Marsarchaeota archaeon]|jgi:hypothetical protein|nr:hypothetical protein [Candidatus Marsarchaeota archaeon]MCL5419186.1 hypothetical protein [Candidatus Marsarchaeota archaeon]
MKIAIAVNVNKELVPLDAAEYIYVYNEADGSVVQNDNLGFGNKEATMANILRLGVDAIAVKAGTLCPGSYAMSQGSIRYSVVNGNTVEDVIGKKELGKDLREQLDAEMYAEYGE